MAPLNISPEVTEALGEVRNDKASSNFAVVQYDPAADNSTTLILQSKGDNGVAGILQEINAVENDQVRYILIRVDFNYETVGAIKADVSRFIFIYLRPEKLPLRRKMMLGSVEGQIKKLFSPFIRTFEIESPEELSEEKIKSIVEKITNKNDNVTEAKQAEKGALLIGGVMISQRTATTDTKSAHKFNASYNKVSEGYSQAKGAEVVLENQEDFQAALKDFRSDSVGTDWLLCSYKDRKTLSFTAAGSSENNPVTTLLENCPEGVISYGLFRLTEDFDSLGIQGHASIKQVRFGFVTYVPPGVSPTLKAVVSTHKSTVMPYFRPFHAQFYVEDKTELDEAKAMANFQAASGSVSKVTDRKAVKVEEKYERKMLGGTTKDVQALQFSSDDDKAGIISSIKLVRDDQAAETWTIARLTGPKKALVLTLGPAGSGFDGLKSELEGGKDTVQYAFVRYGDKVDGIDTTKFALLCYQGEVQPGVRAAAGTLHGAIQEVFGQIHANAFVANADEIQEKYGL